MSSLRISEKALRIAAWAQAIGITSLFAGAILQSQFRHADPDELGSLELVSRVVLGLFPAGALTQLVALPWFFLSKQRGKPLTGGQFLACSVGVLYAAYWAFVVYVCAFTPRCHVW